MSLDTWDLGRGSRIFRRSASFALVLLAYIFTVGLAYAGEGGRAKVKLIVADSVDSKSADEAYERARLQEITKEAARRVRKRLKTARIKNFDVETEAPRTVRVSAGGGVSHSLLAGIVAPQGRFALRPVEPVGERWTKISTKLPAGVEVRQKKGSLEAEDAYLWSRSRAKLAKAIAQVDAGAYEIETYPAGGGWRTLALAAPVATHKDVAGASIRMGKTGDVYVRLTFRHKVSAAHLAARTHRTFAVVLDEEVVATFQRIDTSFGSSLTVTAPEHLQSDRARKLWAQQVAGRLAAYMTVPLIEVNDD
ncbi:hypothetical protein FIV42_20950 [Persicimonas caeni]|uniref:Uncharacterized protein n=1 Tax=Persicimonas caeni TaxID=2292766 RepID=A0A4Y6PY80_PERCE|nr:hypothetical protein [Persicimonas caeni]QDG53119.1 hypothetical protein FIV42_20950 [Persicimonas caeni]QED34341.1 hypothetical protein FRD00_20945 [Persicimonas caeni]